MKKLKNLYLIVGRSGSGKSTVETELHKRYGTTPLRSYTDRPQRGPTDNTHTFVTETEFNALRPEMIAYTLFHGHQYGATLTQLRESDTYVVDPDGIFSLNLTPSSNVKVINLNASKETLIERMRERGDSEETIKSRLANDEKKFAREREITYDLVVDANQPLEHEMKEILDFINEKEKEQ